MEHRPYLYRFTELSTGKQYVGGRWAFDCFPEETCYHTSSEIVKPLIKANPNNWIKEILCIAETKYIQELEIKYLKLVDAKNNPLYYNKHNGGAAPSSQLGIPATGKAAKGHIKTGLRAKGMPATGKNAKGVLKGPQTGKAAKGVLRGPRTGKAAKGVPKTGNSAKGVPKTGNSAKGTTRKIVTCPYCNKVGGSNLMKRYHFDNCKLKGK